MYIVQGGTRREQDVRPGTQTDGGEGAGDGRGTNHHWPAHGQLVPGNIAKWQILLVFIESYSPHRL